jgi:hypothetical protein
LNRCRGESSRREERKWRILLKTSFFSFPRLLFALLTGLLSESTAPFMLLSSHAPARAKALELFRNFRLKQQNAEH